MRLLGLDVHRPPLPEPYGELRRLFGVLEVDHVIDVGANDGQYLAGIRDAVGFGGRVDCVEPQPACAARVREGGRAHVHECGLGEASGVLPLTIYRDTSLASFHALNTVGVGLWDDPATADVVEVVEVPVRTLDDLLDEVEVGQRVWLKIDTQGHDLAVLAGLDRWAHRVVGVQTEVAFTPLYDGAPEAPEHLAYLAGRGFRLAHLTPISRVDGGAIAEADGLFLRA